MKLFYSELASNPSYYSFGYSVYGQIEEGESLSEVYEKGFLPAVIVQTQPDLFYMCRGSRVRLAGFTELHKLGRVRRKIEELPGGVQVVVHKKEDFPQTEEFIDFLLNYFHFRHGKNSMSKERILAVLASPHLSHIAEYRIHGERVAYALEVQGDTFAHIWYFAYAKKYEGKHLGSYIMLDFICRSRDAGKSYAYLGVTYGIWMEYKTIYQPLEYWDGATWVQDPKSQLLKALLKNDHLRKIVLSDAWRGGKKNYYIAPYSYTDDAKILRRVELAFGLYPRLTVSIVLFSALIACALILNG